MKIITKYLLLKYLKYFIIILISLELFFAGFDYLQNYARLPQSANLQLLYLLYNGFFILTITLPLSILFAWLVTLSVLIKENSLVSFYSLGLSKKSFLTPIITISFILTSFLMILQSSPLAYSYEQKNKILKNQYFVNEKSNILLKYNDNFIYFKKLFPLEKKAIDIHIFKIKNNQLIQTIIAKKAYYQNDRWYVIDAKIISKPDNIIWEESKLKVSYEKFLYTLKGFKPEVISNVYKAKVQYSIPDAIYTILLFENQELNTNKIKAILYSKLFVPYFVLPILIMIFLYTNISSRFFNMGRFISFGVFISLVVWAIFFLLQKLSLGNVLNAELALLLPLAIIIIITKIVYNKKSFNSLE
jgi:lipopolysaccharide export system permease protein